MNSTKNKNPLYLHNSCLIKDKYEHGYMTKYHYNPIESFVAKFFHLATDLLRKSIDCQMEEIGFYRFNMRTRWRYKTKNKE